MIKEFSDQTLSDVVDLHMKVLHWSINARLGRSHVMNLYSILVHDNNTFGCVYYQNDLAIAFLVGTKNSKTTRKRIFSSYNLITKCKLLFQSFGNFFDLIDLFENQFLIPVVLGRLEIQAELLTMVADSDNVISPFAIVKCYNRMLSRYNQLGFNYCYGQVAFNPNPSIYRFYQTDGAQLIKSFIRNKIYKISAVKKRMY